MADRDDFDSLSSAPVPGIDETTPDGRPASDELSALKAELEKTKAQVEEERNLYLRALADFDNYKKRLAREQVAQSDRARRDLLRRMLEVLDNFERAAAYRESGTASEQLVDGILATVKQLSTLLDNEGVRPIEVKGKPFDPKVSEAVGTRADAQAAPNTVVDEARKGYSLGQELLRPAQVIVSTPPE